MGYASSNNSDANDNTTVVLKDDNDVSLGTESNPLTLKKTDNMDLQLVELNLKILRELKLINKHLEVILDENIDLEQGEE